MKSNNGERQKFMLKQKIISNEALLNKEPLWSGVSYPLLASYSFCRAQKSWAFITFLLQPAPFPTPTGTHVAERWKGLFPHASKDLMVWAVGHLYLLFKSSQLRALRILQDQKKNRNHNIFLSFRKWEEKKIHSSANPALSPVLLILVWMSASAAFLISDLQQMIITCPPNNLFLTTPSKYLHFWNEMGSWEVTLL